MFVFLKRCHQQTAPTEREHLADSILSSDQSQKSVATIFLIFSVLNALLIRKTRSWL